MKPHISILNGRWICFRKPTELVGKGSTPSEAYTRFISGEVLLKSLSILQQSAGGY